MVLEVDSATGCAKVSYREGEVTQIITMPVSEVVGFLGSGNTLKLDKLSASETDERVIEKDSRWFFHAREGEHGPFADESMAKRELKRHILSAQEEGRTGRPVQSMIG